MIIVADNLHVVNPTVANALLGGDGFCLAWRKLGVGIKKTPRISYAGRFLAKRYAAVGNRTDHC